MVRMKQIGFSYGQKKLFSQLNLDIPQGNIYGLLGINGAGKTTLLKLLSGQLFPSEGETSVLGYNPIQRKPEMLSDLFHLPEEFMLPNVKGNMYVDMYAPFYPKFDHVAFTQYSKDFSLDNTEQLSSLSFGQKKKFLLSFGLASNTSLLILDEPTNGLDIPSKSQFRRTVASAMTENRTFIISTHQVRDMENLIDPIIIVHDGAIVFNHSLSEVAEKFTMSIERSEPLQGDVVFTEKVPGGWMTMRMNTKQEDTPIDLETLFNAVVSQPYLFSASQGGAV